MKMLKTLLKNENFKNVEKLIILKKVEYVGRKLKSWKKLKIMKQQNFAEKLKNIIL